MENISDFFELLLNTSELIRYGGLLLLLVIIFLETGVFFGFIFAGDALLFSAGFLCGTTNFDVNIFLLLFSVTGAAIAGNLAGYYTGRYFGKRLFSRKDTLFFKQRHLENTRLYYQKYGGISLIAGRFVPVVRTFVPIFAGAIEMKFWKFNYYNVTGACIWVWGLIPLGYFVAKFFPGSASHLEYFIIGITIITMTVLIRGFIKFIRRDKNTNQK